MRGPALAALLLVPLAAAAAQGGGEELLRVEFPEDAWHAVRLTVGPESAFLQADLAFAGDELRFASADFWLLDAEGTVLWTDGPAWASAGDVLEVHAELPGPGEVVALESGGGSGSVGAGTPTLGLGPGEYTLVTAAALDGGPALRTLLVAAEGPVAVGAMRSGPEVALWREADFEGGTNVVLDAPDPVEAQARLLQGGAVGLTVEHSLFGYFVGMASQGQDLAVFAPEGVLEGQSFYGFDNAGHGSYQFLVRSLTDVRASVPFCAENCPGPAVWALVADVLLP